jgi:hypothetical protein
LFVLILILFQFFIFLFHLVLKLLEIAHDSIISNLALFNLLFHDLHLLLPLSPHLLFTFLHLLPEFDDDQLRLRNDDVLLLALLLLTTHLLARFDHQTLVLLLLLHYLSERGKFFVFGRYRLLQSRDLVSQPLFFVLLIMNIFLLVFIVLSQNCDFLFILTQSEGVLIKCILVLLL